MNGENDLIKQEVVVKSKPYFCTNFWRVGHEKYQCKNVQISSKYWTREKRKKRENEEQPPEKTETRRENTIKVQSIKIEEQNSTNAVDHIRSTKIKASMPPTQNVTHRTLDPQKVSGQKNKDKRLKMNSPTKVTNPVCSDLPTLRITTEKHKKMGEDIIYPSSEDKEEELYGCKYSWQLLLKATCERFETEQKTLRLRREERKPRTKANHQKRKHFQIRRREKKQEKKKNNLEISEGRNALSSNSINGKYFNIELSWDWKPSREGLTKVISQNKTNRHIKTDRATHQHPKSRYIEIQIKDVLNVD